MRSCTATEAKTHFGKLLDQVQHRPVQVLKHGRVVGVMVSAQDHEAMRNFCANRL
ncbi:type II toxin-antitoxin system Phd/YefM family antitoxin [Hydrogenophaga sp. SL48]|uniref:type II toxin-antitoxin system Phd/YefM family antitoxin n=1 Tax=Hydrogenophaga sp. SL48 TaxID=2806347 RepID=UPI001F21B073|nr:type II toxin-antitoxin system Phd/YefM family antitoxin [Hydrogenophaga sp. SL48]